jgi:RNA polymerase sigma-70 factor (ECF subfamily)
MEDMSSSSTDALRRLADEDLMQLVRTGSAPAFEVIVDRHQNVAYALAYRMTGARGTAEDVVQDALLSVWRSSDRYDPRRGSLRNWLLGVVHNRAIDVLRRGNVHERRRASADGIEDRLEAKERTEVEVAHQAQAREVQAALAELPAEQERIVTLAYFGGFTHVEIAEMLDLPLGTIKGRMRLALDKLAASLADHRTLA